MALTIIYFFFSYFKTLKKKQHHNHKPQLSLFRLLRQPNPFRRYSWRKGNCHSWGKWNHHSRTLYMVITNRGCKIFKSLQEFAIQILFTILHPFVTEFIDHLLKDFLVMVWSTSRSRSRYLVNNL